MKTRKERMYGAPLCASDCNSWFEDCKEDYTCAANWARDFVWENGKNVCPHWARCTTFKEMYSNASNFCEVVSASTYFEIEKLKLKFLYLGMGWIMEVH